MVSKRMVKEKPAKPAELTPEEIRRIREKLGK
jgi:DNA-binding transcriptional regulator YiaG